jgi:RHS repeat-associated protein
VATLVDSLGSTKTTSFSSGGDLTGVTLPAVYGTQGASESWGYGAPAPAHYPGSYTAFDGQQYAFAYSTSSTLSNDVTSITEPSGGQWAYSYYNDGNLNTVTDPNSHTTTFTDTGGNITKITPPSPLGAETIGYDGLSRITSTTDGKGQLTQFAYDALDRVTQVTYQDGTVVKYNYNPDDLVTSVEVNKSTVESFTYNSLNQQTMKTVGKTSVTYGFDGVGNLTSFTDANGTVTYAYDPANNLTKLTSPGGSPVVTFTVTNDNLRKSTVFPSGVGDTLATAYDQANRPCLVVAAPSANIPSPLTCSSAVPGALTSYSYSYQNSSSGTDTNRIQSVTDNVTGKTTTYKYWVNQELCWAYAGTSTAGCSSPPTGATSYNYDPAGNITSVTENGSTTSLAYNNADELTSAGSTAYSYDADGNLTGASNGLAYTYNALNQATSITPPGGSKVSLSYTGPGQDELSQAGPDTLANTLLGVSSKTSGNNTTYYVRDNTGKLVYQQLPSGSKDYYLFDAKGTVTGLANPTGSLIGGTPYAYDPYGTLTQGQTSVDNPWLFQGQYSLLEDQNSTFGLYHMGARYYQPAIERWTQPDPSVSGQSPLDQNRYLFGADDAINNTDPTGADWTPIQSYLFAGSLIFGSTEGAIVTSEAISVAYFGAALAETAIAVGIATGILGTVFVLGALFKSL